MKSRYVVTALVLCILNAAVGYWLGCKRTAVASESPLPVKVEIERLASIGDELEKAVRLLSTAELPSTVAAERTVEKTTVTDELSQCVVVASQLRSAMEGLRDQLAQTDVGDRQNQTGVDRDPNRLRVVFDQSTADASGSERAHFCWSADRTYRTYGYPDDVDAINQSGVSAWHYWLGSDRDLYFVFNGGVLQAITKDPPTAQLMLRRAMRQAGAADK
jgi:hypothetical protein